MILLLGWKVKVQIHLKLKPEQSDTKFQAALTAGPSIFLVKHHNQQKFN